MATFGKFAGANDTEFCDDSSEPKLIRLSSNKVKASVTNHLKSENILNKRATYICEKCVDYCSKNLIPSEEKHSFNELISNIKSGAFTNEQLVSISEALGESQRAKLSKDAAGISSSYDNYPPVRTPGV